MDSSQPLSRRRFLGSAAAAAAGAALVRMPGRAAVATPRRARAAGAGPLPSYVGELNPSLLVGPNKLWEWQNFHEDTGPHFTGSPNHVAYLDFLESECQSYGLTTFHDPTQVFPRWNADHRDCRLSLVENGSFTDLDVMSYFPGSGSTLNLPGGALTAELVDVGMGLPQDFAAGIATGSLRGKIAFLSEPVLPTTMALGYPNYYNHDPDHTMTPLTPFNKWSLNILSPQSVGLPTLAAQAGCAGVVISLEATAKCARGQYFPFGYTVRGNQLQGGPGIPMLYIDYRTGQDIRARLAAVGASTSARMVLPATVHPGTGTDQIIAFLPGAEGDPHDLTVGENIVVASHTDGTSASEENGPLGMLAIAKYFAQIPRSQRRRSMVFVFATGHFCGYTEDTPWFVEHHPEILAKTAATMSIEHLGQKSFTDDPKKNTYTDDGLPEIGISYVTQDPAIITTVSQNYAYEGLLRAPVVNGPGFGVATAFILANLPSYAYITGPNALYQMDKQTGLEGTDPVRMHREIRSFVRILNAWESLSMDELRAGKSGAAQAVAGAQ